MPTRTETVTVRGTGPYIARCCGKTASSTMSAESAAEKAAAKAAGFPIDRTGSVIILPDTGIKISIITDRLGFASFEATWPTP